MEKALEVGSGLSLKTFHVGIETPQEEWAPG